MNSEVARSIDGYIIHFICIGSRPSGIMSSFEAGTTIVDLTSDSHIATVDVDTMICINGTMVIYCCCIARVTCCNTSLPSINIQCIKRNRFANIALKHCVSAASLDI